MDREKLLWSKGYDMSTRISIATELSRILARGATKSRLTFPGLATSKQHRAKHSRNESKEGGKKRKGRDRGKEKQGGEEDKEGGQRSGGEVK